MKFLQVFLLLSLIYSLSFGDEYREKKTISLAKDEQKKILVKYEDSSKLFKFSWTLYKNLGLVIHRSYDKVIAQNILYQEMRNRFFRLELRSRGANRFNPPYLLVKFKEFDYETKKAIFELFLYDKDLEIELVDLNNFKEV
ncbi:hypothetical protein M947_09350 [Sulfurimonas hongkongensis]|uniref:Uncharacterized protein n=1 Tax=Sulfurimonas hongkongensis TaxID=1172190 RepID=T0KFE6_9BACT|nr:hypothetical protein [Sulfurimonas hongkongensis]EQB35479.1 hypothetical protein M947_09350 [Sulfurimonas hongkongensis]